MSSSGGYSVVSVERGEIKLWAIQCFVLREGRI